MAISQQVDMICVCGSDGALRPLRFRFEDELRELQVVDIAEVVSCREITHIGVEAMIFVCRTFDGAREHMVEIKYTLRTHQWALRRLIY